jgi:hypothetical protein
MKPSDKIFEAFRKRFRKRIILGPERFSDRE